MPKETEFRLTTEIIELQQLLKAVDWIGSGGEVRAFLAEHEVRINGELDSRRSRKLRAGDQVEVKELGLIRIK